MENLWKLSQQISTKKVGSIGFYVIPTNNLNLQKS